MRAAGVAGLVGATTPGRAGDGTAAVVVADGAGAGFVRGVPLVHPPRVIAAITPTITALRPATQARYRAFTPGLRTFRPASGGREHDERHDERGRSGEGVLGDSAQLGPLVGTQRLHERRCVRHA